MGNDLTLFQQLCMRIVTEPDFATRLLKGTAEERKEALEGFLPGAEVDQIQALDDFITAIAKMDMDALESLRKTIDGGERVPV